MGLNAYHFDQAIQAILHEYALSMVDHIGFREFVTTLGYDNERLKALKMTDKNGSRMAITTDIRTSSNKKKGFMVITTHFIDQTWTLQSWFLR